MKENGGKEMIVTVDKFTLSDFRPFSKMKLSKEIIFAKTKINDTNNEILNKNDQADWEPLKKI